MTKASKCKGCQASIIWMKTSAGKNIAVNWREELQGVKQFEFGKMEAHFSTCPDADKFRR